MKNLSFVAFDIETPTKHQNSICQIGFAVVEEGRIVESKSFLVQPPDNKYHWSNMEVHHITPKHTEDAPPFNEIWPLISKYLEGKNLVVHNASFDMTVLEKCMDLYDLDKSRLGDILACTCTLNGTAKLGDCCKAYGISLENAHDAGADAYACAELYIKMETEGYREVKKSKTKSPRQQSIWGTTDSKIDHDLFTPDTTNADPNNPFYGRKVVITGTFAEYPKRNTLAKKIKSLGADIDSSITKKTKFVIKGQDAGPKKLEAIQKLQQSGYNLTVLSIEDFDRIYNGDFKKDEFLFWEGKNLQLNKDHLEKFAFPMPAGLKNILGGAEVYIDPFILGNKMHFNQLFGFLGAYANGELEDSTHWLIGDITWEVIMNGGENETIRYIQEYYNNNRSISFDCSIIKESDFVNYYEERVRLLNDTTVANLFEKYKESAIDDIPRYHREILLAKFKKDMNYAKIDGKVVFKTEDGRTWCPGRQFRGESINIKEEEE